MSKIELINRNIAINIFILFLLKKLVIFFKYITVKDNFYKSPNFV